MPTRNLDGSNASAHGYRAVGPLSGGAPLFRPQDPFQRDLSPIDYSARAPYTPALSAPPANTSKGETRNPTSIANISVTRHGLSAMQEHVTDLHLLDIAILGHSATPGGLSPVELIVAVRKERRAPSLDASIIFRRVAHYAAKGWLLLTREGPIT